MDALSQAIARFVLPIVRTALRVLVAAFVYVMSLRAIRLSVAALFEESNELGRHIRQLIDLLSKPVISADDLPMGLNTFVGS